MVVFILTLIVVMKEALQDESMTLKVSTEPTTSDHDRRGNRVEINATVRSGFF